jgi:hypothetical protein
MTRSTDSFAPLRPSRRNFIAIQTSGVDMSVTRIIILAVACGLAYAGLSAGIVQFATLIP